MTAISYPDIVVHSPDRAFRLEARSPDNRPKGHPDRTVAGSTFNDDEVSFQRAFCFTLYEGDSAQVVWTLEQAAVSATSPSAAHVSDRGWVVVQTHDHLRSEVVAISPSGKRGMTLDVAAALVTDPISRRHVHETTAGPSWSGQSHAWFATLSGREHFWLRTWWGDRVLLDLEGGSRVAASEHEGRLAAEEAAWALSALGSFDADADPWSGPWDEWLTAITLAGRVRLGSAERLIRPFESISAIWSSSSTDVLSTGWAQLHFFYQTYRTRPFATLALRRLGAQPRGFASYVFGRPGAPGEHLELPECIQERDQRAVRPGMKGLDVLQLLGAPDLMDGRRWSWDTESDSTLRLTFTDGVVKSLETLRPPGWIIDADREQAWTF